MKRIVQVFLLLLILFQLALLVFCVVKLAIQLCFGWKQLYLLLIAVLDPVWLFFAVPDSPKDGVEIMGLYP